MVCVMIQGPIVKHASQASREPILISTLISK
uniref:Uncharacterized protein n=1 Tax=Arundo donax TaxID=35708 RepID=A0A0A9B9C2_ARUDO